MADIESNIRFGVDTSDAIASIKMLQAQISAFQKQMASSSVANAESARKLRRGLIDDLNASGQWSASIKNIQSSSESFTNALEKNKLSMGEYFRYGASQVGGFRKTFTKEFDTIEKVARERVKDLQTQYISLGRDANGALKAIAVRPLKLDMESLATQTAINAQRQQIFNQLLKQGSTNLLNFGKNTQWAGRQLMVGFTIPLSIFGTMASKTFMELEQQAIRFKRVYGELFTPPEEADEMIDTLKELAKEFTKYGVAVEKTLGLAADAAAMGKTGVELLDQVTEANRLAVLGNVEQQQALETTISLTNAFGTATEDLAKKIDFLNAVENQTVVSIEDLTIAIPKAGPVVQQLGGDVEDLAFFLTAMKEGGINASEGANALKSGLASLINPTGQAANMLKVFGINVKEIVDGSRGDVRKLVVDFASALDTLDPSQRAQAIEQLFGKFQFSRLSTLFQNVIQEGTQASRVLELTNATTQELAQLSSKELKRVEESTTFRFKKAIEEFNAAVAPVGEQFLKLITPIIEFATKIIEQFNSLSDNAKGFITGLTVLLGAVGPVALMTFGLLANGVANIIKGFTFVRELFQRTGKQSTILGEQFDYLTTEQLQAAAVSASLDQVHQTLIQTFSSEASAVKKLGDVYRMAFNEQQRFDTGRAIAKQAGLKLASGIVSVPGPKGAGDIVPAVLSPGEAVIPADAAKKYAPIIQGMIAGNLPGFSQGVMLGMPRSGKGTQKDREAAEQIYEMFLQSSYASVPPRKYGHQLAKTTGHSFPIFGLGGVYMSPEGEKVFVKPVLDERAAVAEMRATEIARRAHGLKSPEQRIVVMQDPTDVRRQRRFLALESPLDPTFANNQPMALFNEEQYFRQLVASLLRVDKDLSASNVFGDVVADVGPAGVFTRASGLRDYAENLPSMEEQAMINLLGIKGGAKRAFAESTLSLMAGLTPQQYQQRMVSEIQRVIPLLEETIASFNLTDPREVKVYQDMVARLRQGLGVDWSKFHAIHSAVKPTQPKQTTVPGYKNGVVSVPGPKGAGDVMPAMLSPGEAVIPADKAKKYAGFIQQMIYGKIPGYEDSNVVKVTQTRLRQSFGDSGTTRLQASHFQGLTPEEALETLRKDLALLGKEAKDSSVLVREYYEEVDESGKKVVVAKDSIMTLSEVVEKFADGKTKMAFGGQTFGASTVLESAVRNQKAYAKMESAMSPEERATIGKLGAPETLQDLVVQGDLAARALVQFKGKLTKEVQTVLENIVNEGNNAKAALASTNSAEEQLAFAISQREKSIKTHIQYADATLTASQKEEKIAAVNQELENIKQMYVKELQEGMSEQDALNKAVARLRMLALENSSYGPEGMMALHVGDVPNSVIKQAAGNKISETSSSGRETVSNFKSLQRLPVGLPTTAVVANIAQDMILAGAESARVNAESLDAFARQAVVDYLDSFYNGITDGMMDFAQINSPSDRTDDTIGKPLVEGMEAGALSGKDDMQQAGAILAETAADSAAAAAGGAGTRGPSGAVKVGKRRVTTNPAAIAAYQEEQGLQTQTKPGPRRASRPSTDLGAAAREQAMTSALVAEANQSQARAATESAAKMQAMNSMIMNGTFALSSLTGVLSLFGGEFAELNQTLFGITTALFTLMQVTQMLTQAKVVEIAKTQFSAATARVEGLTRAANMAGKPLVGFGGMLLKAGTFVARFLGPMGLAITAVSVFAALIGFAIDKENKRRAALEAFAKTVKLADEQLDYLASKFNVTAKEISFGEPIAPGEEPSGAPTSSQLRSDEDFLTKFEAQINSLKSATDEAAVQQIEGLSMNLSSQGYSAAAIKEITEALLKEAGKNQIELDIFKKNPDGTLFIDVDPKKTVEDLVTNIQKSGAELVAAKRGSMGAGNAEDQYLSDVGSAVAYTDAALRQIRAGLEDGTLEAQDYQDQLAQIFTPITELQGDDLTTFIESLAESMDIDVDALTSDYDKVLAAKMAVAGLEISDDDVKTLNAGGKEAEAVRKRLNKLILGQADNIKKVVNERAQEKLIDENYGTATAALNDRVVALQNQSGAYQTLIDQGYDAETAFELAGDSALAAGIQAAIGAGVGSQEWKDLKALLDQVIDLEAKAPKGPGGAGDKSDYQKSIESLQDQRKEIINNNVALNKLRQAGFDIASAMKAAEDPITAAALASTKVGTDKWKNLISSIRQTQALLSKKEIKDLLLGKQIEIADKKSQAIVSTALSRLGYTAEQIDDVLSNQEFTNTLAKDLQDGSINSKELRDVLIEIKKLGKLEITANLATKEGAAEEFQKSYDKVVGYLQAKQETIEIGFQLKTDADRTIVREAEDLIAAIQYKIDDYEAELVGIEEQEELINKKYDDRKAALDKIAKANDRIAKQQKGQLTLADALSKGDMAAAAQAIQDIRAQQAEDSVAGQGDLLEASKQRELDAVRSSSGKSRKQLEEDIKKLKKDIFDIEEKTLEPANERIRLAGVEKAAAVASLDSQILKWEELAAKVNEAKLKLTPEEMTAMQTQAGLIADMLQNWDDIDSKEATLTIRKKIIGDVVDGPKPPKPPVVPGDSGGGSGSDSDSGNTDSSTNFRDSGLSTAGYINRTDEGTLARIPTKPTSDAGIGKTWQLDATNTWRAVTSPKPPYNPGIGNTWYWDTFTDTWRIQPIAGPKKLAVGGSVTGPGTSTSDSIPAMLSDGEYVVRASSVDKLGTGFLNFINENGKLPGFAIGGAVSKQKPKPKPGDAGFYKPRTTSEAISMGMQMVMDNITRGMFGQAGANAKYGVKNTAGDVVDSVATTLLNALPIPAVKGVMSTAKFGKAVKNSLDKDYVLRRTQMVDTLPAIPGMPPQKVTPYPVTKRVEALSPSLYASILKDKKAGTRSADDFLQTLPLRGFEDYSVRTQNFMGNMLGSNLPYQMRRKVETGISSLVNKVASPGIRSIPETLRLRHRSTQPLLEDFVTHPSAVPVASGRTYGPGTYFAKDPRTSKRLFRGFGDNVYKPKLTIQGMVEQAKSKGYLKLGEDSLPPLGNMDWNDPFIQDAMKQGYIGIKHNDAYTNWLIGTSEDFSLKKVTKFKLPQLGNPYAMGGLVKPKYFNAGGMVKGYAMGGDIVPSMLTPGEFVMSKYAVQNYGLDKMKAINSGTYNGDSMYNYEINVNVQTDANADQIAKAVIGQIKQIDSQKIRGNRF